MYIAPEVQEGERYDKSADVYSFAMTMFALINPEVKVIQAIRAAYFASREKTKKELSSSGRSGFVSSMCSPIILQREVMSHGLRPFLPEPGPLTSSAGGFTQSLSDLISASWATDRTQRPDFAEILSRLEGDVKHDVLAWPDASEIKAACDHATASGGGGASSMVSLLSHKKAKMSVERAAGSVDEIPTVRRASMT